MRVLLRGSERAAAADVHDAAQPTEPRRAGHRRADARLPVDQGSRHGRVVELPRQERHPAVQAASAGRARRHVADAAGGRRARAGISQVHRVLSLPGRLSRPARSQAVRRLHRTAVSDLRRGARDASARRGAARAGAEDDARHRLLQHHEVLHESLPGEHQDYG